MRRASERGRGGDGRGGLWTPPVPFGLLPCPQGPRPWTQNTCSTKCHYNRNRQHPLPQIPAHKKVPVGGRKTGKMCTFQGVGATRVALVGIAVACTLPCLEPEGGGGGCSGTTRLLGSVPGSWGLPITGREGNLLEPWPPAWEGRWIRAVACSAGICSRAKRCV